MNSATYIVKTEGFEGPLELLLSLIEKRKLLINDISLATVTDDFMRFVETHQDFPLGQAAHFVVVASTLLLIKSRSLLPALELSEEEEGTIEELELRLKLYKLFRTSAKELEEGFGQTMLFAKSPTNLSEPVFSPDPSLTKEELCSTIQQLLKKLPKQEPKEEATVQQVIRLEEVIARLAEKISKSIAVNFNEFSQIGKKEKVGVIVGFLAMLELVKRGIITVKQEAQFGDITMHYEQVEIPRYH